MMVADQSPSSDKGIHWVDFMNIKTPFYRGIEFFPLNSICRSFYRNNMYEKI